MGDFTKVETATLIDLLVRGDNLPAGIADTIDRHPKSVSRSLAALSERGLTAEKNDYHVWTLTAGGRKEAMELAIELEKISLDYPGE